ncbi:unnamed protein product [Orchesella dallaii]|uniref:THAP-type domain-containing protein n=1 Tax=Orchesella dallaii TaxID=48710 RepID=A0ABP1PTD4_9HEXA
MGRRCAITGCANYADKPINTVHLFPKSNPYMRKRWIEFVKMASNLDVEKVNLENFGICVRHFSSSSYSCIQTEESRTERSRTDVLKPTAVPTLLGSVNAVVDDYFRYEHDYCLASPSTNSSKLHDLEIKALHWEIHRLDVRLVQPLNKTTEELISKIGSDIESTPLVFENFGILSRIEEGGREYISGFIAGELQKEYPHLSKRGAREYRESFWVGRLSGGGLVEPSLPWHDVFKKFDVYFETFHGFSSIYKGSGAYKQLEDILIANFPNIEEKIIKYFVRVRTNIRIAHLNKKIEDDKFKYQVSRREKVAADGNPEEGNEMSERAEGIYHILSTNF